MGCKGLVSTFSLLKHVYGLLNPLYAGFVAFGFIYPIDVFFLMGIR